MTAIFTKDELRELARLHASETIGEGRHEVFVFDTFGLSRIAQYFIEKERKACANALDEMAAADKLTNYYKAAALRIRERGAP